MQQLKRLSILNVKGAWDVDLGELSLIRSLKKEIVQYGVDITICFAELFKGFVDPWEAVAHAVLYKMQIKHAPSAILLYSLPQARQNKMSQ